MADVAHVSTLHMVTAYLGVLIGGVTFTGSIVAFLKLAGRVKSSPVVLPGKHLVNTSLLGANVASMGAFLTMAPGSPMIAATCLGANTILSFLKGLTTTSAIGGADMRKSKDRLFVRFLADIWTSCRHHCSQCLLWICTSR